MEGVQPKWPSLSKVIGLATNTYRRLKASGVWDGVASKRSKACNLTRSNLSPSSSSNTKISCWNCGGSHHLDDCPKPVDQARADKARRAYRTKKGPRRNQDKPLRKTGPDGGPLIRDEKGACVLDSKKMKTLQANYGHYP